jgi:DNA-binding transcriptional regulator YdaS (Cro superfamily)
VDQKELSPFEAFDLAVTRAGSQSALARICGCTVGNINQLLQKKSQLPGEYVLDVEAATGVSRHDLRPDLYPRGLQDGVPFSPPASLPDGDDQVADQTQGVLQPAAPEWPIGTADDDSEPSTEAAA